MEKKKFKRPFPNLNINDISHLFELEDRFECSGCKKSRKFFCYTCSRPNPVSDEAPHIKIPFKIDIIKNKKELVGKSTSCHAKLVASEDVEIYEYPTIPDYKEEDKAVLIFVSPDAVDIKSLFRGHKKLKLKHNYGFAKGSKPSTLLKKNLSEIVDDEALEEYESDYVVPNQAYSFENLPIKKAVFIDSTWSQCRGMFKDERLKNLTCVIIQNRETQFWRPNGKHHPSWFLATIEAIHQFLFEFHVFAWGIEKNYFDNCLHDLKLISTDWIPKDKIIDTSTSVEKKETLLLPYNGQYDNLLYYFSFVYSLVHSKVKKFIEADAREDKVPS